MPITLKTNGMAFKDADGTYKEFDAIKGDGIPSGGETGQVLAKKSDSDRDTEWKTVELNDVAYYEEDSELSEGTSIDADLLNGHDSNYFAIASETDTVVNYAKNGLFYSRPLTDKALSYTVMRNSENISTDTFNLPFYLTGNYSFGYIMAGWNESTVSCIPFMIQSGGAYINSAENHTGLTFTLTVNSTSNITLTASGTLWGGFVMFLAQ